MKRTRKRKLSLKKKEIIKININRWLTDKNNQVQNNLENVTWSLLPLSQRNMEFFFPKAENYNFIKTSLT